MALPATRVAPARDCQQMIGRPRLSHSFPWRPVEGKLRKRKAQELPEDNFRGGSRRPATRIPFKKKEFGHDLAALADGCRREDCYLFLTLGTNLHGNAPRLPPCSCHVDPRFREKLAMPAVLLCR